MANGSIVDYLNSTGKDSSFQARSQLAKNSGIENFTGTAQQNTQLLNQLQSGTPIQKGTISAPGVENASTLNIPPAPAPEIANNIISSTAIPVEQPPVTATPEQTGFQSDAQNILSELKSKQGIFQELGLGGITDTFEELLKKGQFTADAEKAAGISKKTVALNEIESQLRETDLKFRREREAIQNSAGSAASKSAEIADVSRKQASELADLSVISATRRDDLATAQTLVDRKVELTFEPIQQKLEYQKFLFEENKGLFNQVEQRMFDERVRKEQVQIDKDKFLFQQLEDEKLALIQNSNSNGASNGVLKAIQNAKTIEEATKAAGRYGISIDEKYKKAQLSKLNAENAKEAAALSGYQLTGKEKFTEGSYAVRMEDGDTVVRNFEQNVILQNGDFPSAKDGVKLRAKGKLPAEFQDEKFKQFIQGQENFISAVLRKESGAAISDEEYAREARKYFPQPKDGADVIAQKQRSRQVALEGMKGASEGGYNAVKAAVDTPFQLDASGNIIVGSTNGSDQDYWGN